MTIDLWRPKRLCLCRHRVPLAAARFDSLVSLCSSIAFLPPPPTDWLVCWGNLKSSSVPFQYCIPLSNIGIEDSPPPTLLLAFSTSPPRQKYSMHSSSFRSHSVILQRQFNYNHKSCTTEIYRHNRRPLFFSVHLVSKLPDWQVASIHFSRLMVKSPEPQAQHPAVKPTDWWIGLSKITQSILNRYLITA